jgi:hypothetical protein
MNRYFPLSMLALLACGGDGGGIIQPEPTLNDISTLAPGEYRVLKPSDIPNGIDLPSVPDAREFMIIVGNSSTIGDVEANYVVRGNLGATSTIQPERRSDVSPQLAAGMEALERMGGPQRSLEQRVRGFERRALSFRGVPAVSRTAGPALRRTTQVAAVPVVGERIDLKIPLIDGPTNNLCQDFVQTQAVVASVSNKAILAVDTLDGPPEGLFTQADFDAISAEFDNITYVTDEAFFGTPTDIDGNQRVIMLFTGQVNKLTPPGTPEGSGFIGGFFFAGDFFPPTGPPDQSCAQSNRAEIFYLLAPDPLGLKYGNRRTVSSLRQGTRGTIAHEFEHMINAGRRYTGGVAEDFESSWLDEALAHMGEEVVGRRVKGFTDFQSLTFQDVFPNEAGRNDFNAFFFQNLARFRYWMLRPDTSSGISDEAGENLASRGAGWAILRYSADNFSNGDARAFMRRLVAGPDTGITNFNRATAVPLDTVVAGWLVSNFADDLPGFSITNPRTQYRSFNMRSVMEPVNGTNGYPLRTELLGGSGASLAGTNRTGSGTYYSLAVAANSPARNVKVLNEGGASLVSFPGAHIYVLRVR